MPGARSHCLTKYTQSGSLRARTGPIQSKKGEPKGKEWIRRVLLATVGMELFLGISHAVLSLERLTYPPDYS